MKFKTAIYIEIEVSEATQNEIDKNPDIKRPLCEMVTKDVIGVIKSNVDAKCGINIKGDTKLVR